MKSNPGGDAPFLIDGPAGALEVAAMLPKSGELAGLVIVCHPHSQMGGSLHNKVVHTVARAHRDMGHVAIRFNFRGVGNSEGEFDGGGGEAEDLLAVVRWARQEYPSGRLYLAGFSFGAFVLARSLFLMQSEGFTLEHALLVAPPVQRFDFHPLSAFPCPLKVIMGEEDEVVRPLAVYQWFDSIRSSKTLVRVSGAGHFFHGMLGQLKAIVEEDIA